MNHPCFFIYSKDIQQFLAKNIKLKYYLRYERRAAEKKLNHRNLLKKKRLLRGDAGKDDGWKDSKLFESFLQHDQISVYQSIVERDKLLQIDESQEEKI